MYEKGLAQCLTQRMGSNISKWITSKHIVLKLVWGNSHDVSLLFCFGLFWHGQRSDGRVAFSGMGGRRKRVEIF